MGNARSKNEAKPTSSDQQTISYSSLNNVTPSTSSHTHTSPETSKSPSVNNQQTSSVAATLVRITSPAKEKVPVPVFQITKHDVDNGYMVPKLQCNSIDQVGNVNVPHRRLVDKFGLRVCPQYNSRNGCQAVICRRYHVCISWVKDRCDRGMCDYDHDFLSNHNVLLERTVCNRRGFNTLDCLRENHERKRRVRNAPDAICLSNLTHKCNRPDCSYFHVKVPYKWQLLIDGSWCDFSHKQNDFLEEWFSCPDADQVQLPMVENKLRTHPALRKLYFLLSKSKKNNVFFETMEIDVGDDIIKIRRLSTPSDVSSDHRLATRWVWYWMDDHGCWHPYRDGEGEKFFILALGDHMESSKSDHMNVRINDIHYSIDLLNKHQVNVESGTKRHMRRRPLSMAQKREMSYPELFSILPANKDFLKDPLNSSSSEYAHINRLLKAGMPNICISTVERIQNDHLWKAYQNKKKLLLSLYNNNLSVVNEQYMFHGTRHSVIDVICKENFDWRLFGSNVGNAYGKGIYFTNKSNVSDSYSENSSGLKAVFVAFVLVGTITKGERTMEVPPQNQKYGRCFDTTCNSDSDPSIFVKYNRDEYYPAYIVTYRHTSAYIW